MIVGIGSKKAALGAFTKIIDGAKAYNPDAHIEGVIVEQQAEPGLELTIGGKTDPAFGKVLTFGMGGTTVELMKDVTLRILPVTEDEITASVSSSRRPVGSIRPTFTSPPGRAISRSSPSPVRSSIRSLT